VTGMKLTWVPVAWNSVVRMQSWCCVLSSEIDVCRSVY